MFKKTMLLALALMLYGPVMSQQLDTQLLGDMKFRSIGPAGMSGRVSAIGVVEQNPDIIYAGSSAGGLWLTENGGTTFQPIFDNQKTASIGDIAIYQKNPNTIYVGTGEGNPRNSQAFGYGMYKTLDGGKSWKHLGLEGTKNIHRVIVHPSNPDVVWVGAQGTAFGSSEHRGVYKSTDGGKSWKKTLYVNADTGIADLIIDPANPNRLFAAMWEFRRAPWFMTSGGKGSAIYSSIDGGETWQKLGAKNGIPNETLGRIGLAIAPSNPNVIYANIETKPENAMYRSDNGGRTFVKTTAEGVSDRPFYYSDVFVDPTNENRVYHVATVVSKSEDGGKTFKAMMSQLGGVHSDHHAFWINPVNPLHIVDGNDGGLYMSKDGGKKWRFHHNLPVGQFYHVNVDNEVPYNVYGGMQDNGSWYGPSSKFAIIGGIKNDDYKNIGFGDGFDVLPDPRDNRFGYSTIQGGEFQRYDKQFGLIENIRPRHPEGIELRFNWNAAMALDPFNDSVLYVGSQFVHKSMTNGRSWEIISPDLTTNDPQKQRQSESGGLTIDDSTAENHTTITVITPSSHEPGVIWVGTDDGQIQLTKNGGASWELVSKNLKGVPQGSWVNQIKQSPFNPAEAVVVIEDHMRDNWTPYVYRTRDFGKSWKALVEPGQIWGYALSFVQDPVSPDLMFVGTEFGLFFSINDGKDWQQWKSDFPTVSVKDMVIHPREHDLVVGTFGRSLYVLDDIRPLREIATNPKILSEDFELFQPANPYLGVLGFPNFKGGADESFNGQNKKYGAHIQFYAKKASDKNALKFEIVDSEGVVVRTLKATAKPGVNKLVWDLKAKSSHLPGKPDLASMFLMGGAYVSPGDYTVTTTFNGIEYKKRFTVLADPKAPINMEAYAQNAADKQAFNAQVDELMGMYKRIEGAKKSIGPIAPFIKKDTVLQKEYEGLQTTLERLKYKILPKSTKGLFNDTPDLRGQFMALAFYYFSPMYGNTPNTEIAFESLKKKMIQLEKEVGAMENDMEHFKDKVNQTKVLNLE